ncbi:hypothetical protein, partial [Psychrobacter sp. FME61]
MIKVKYVILLLLPLAGCHELPNKKVNTDNEALDCRQYSIEQEYEMVEPVAPDTGIQRQQPIDVISRATFIERLRISPLWKKLKYKFEENEDYTDTFTFHTSQGYVLIRGDDYLTDITYNFNGAFIGNEFGHTLPKQYQLELIETINLIVNNHDKAVEIF